jgi:hypothetical protein
MPLHEVVGRMRLLCLLLLLANLVVFGSLQLPSRDIERNGQSIAQRELAPYKARVVRTPPMDASREPLSHLMQEEKTSYLSAKTAAVPVCLQWAGISADDENRSQAILDSLGAKYRVANGGGSFELHWVYIPGLTNQAEIENLAAQLRADGERSFTVSPKNAQGSYYISLGVFRSEESAKRQQKRFLRLGAVLEPLGTSRTTYIVEDGIAISEKLGAAAAEEFEQATVKVVECPEIRAG